MNYDYWNWFRLKEDIGLRLLLGPGENCPSSSWLVLSPALVLLSPLSSLGNPWMGAEGLQLLGVWPVENIGLRLLLDLTKFDIRF